MVEKKGTLKAEQIRKWFANLGFFRLSPQSSHWNQTILFQAEKIKKNRGRVRVLGI